MKKIYFSSKKIRTALFVAMGVAFFGAGLSSCKEEEEDPYQDVTVQFKVEANTGVEIKSVVTQVGTKQSTEFVVPGTSWQSGAQLVNTKVGAVHLASTAEGLGPQSFLIVKILVNGEVKAADTTSGVTLMAKTTYDFSKF